MICLQHNFYAINRNCYNITPVDCGFHDCAPSHSFGPAVRPYWLIHFVESGFGKYTVGGKTYSLGPGEMFVISPFVETYYEADEVQPWNYIWVSFTSETELPEALEPVIFCPKAQSAFKRLKSSERFEKSRDAWILSCIWELFALLPDNKTEVDYVEAAQSLIHGQYMNSITVKDIADRIGLERTYFSTLFKAKTGQSPGQYLLNYRMTVAADLMVNHGKSITTAANSVGYSDIFNFSRMFKRRFELSPRNYISKHKKSV